MKKQFLSALISMFFSMIVFGQTPVDLPVTFDNATVNYALVDFGGNISSIVADPVVSTNMVCKIIKTATAELWAGTTIGGTVGFATAIPFSAGATTMTARIYSPDAGIHIRMKVEDPNDATKSVETEALTTVANAWETLTFDFANQASGTAPINFTYTYKKLSLFFNFGITGAVAGTKTYYFDDVVFIPGAPIPVNLPVTFDNIYVNYDLLDFGGNTSSIVNDLVVPSNKVCQVVKSNIAETWAGTTIGGTTGFTTAIPFAAGATTITMRVYSPDAGIPVRMKVEDPGDPGKTVETEAMTTTANAWETLSFNFANQATGTAAINFSYTYKKMSIFFNFGTTGAVAGTKTYYCDDIIFIPAAPVLVDLPVTFDNPAISYNLVDFGGNASSIIADPVVPTNLVCKVIKSNTAELWAGTTIGGTVGFATPVPFIPGSTTITMRVYSPNAGIVVRMKVEDQNNGAISVETDALTTTVNTWETLTFNFANQAAGTPPINFSNTYKKLSVFFNFGTTGAAAGTKTYYFDDVVFGGVVGPTPCSLPVTFDESNVDYGLIDFGGNTSSIVLDPLVSGNHVCQAIKSATSEFWAGTTIGGANGLATAIPFAPGATKISMRVYSPNAGIPVRMKVEDPSDPGKSVETERLTTTSNGWETLVFNFSSQVSGTAALNFAYSYKKMSVFFNYGTSGSVAGEKTYYFDDVAFVPYTPITIYVTFQLQQPDSIPVFAFGSWSGWGNWPGNPLASVGNGFYSVTLPFTSYTSHEFLFVNGGTSPVKEVLNPAWPCTNGNATYTNRVLTLAGTDTTICLNWNSCTSCVIPVIPVNRTLQNVAVLSEEGACYDATQTLTVAGNNTYFRVEAGADVHMVAGQNILMLPGTLVLNGGTLHAYITSNNDYCLTPLSPVVKSTEIQKSNLATANALTLKIFPNPASAEVVLDLHGVADGNSSKMEMISLRGNVILTSSLQGDGQYPLSLLGIPSGAYYFRIISGDQVITKMLLKK
ncbi:MAG: T9SS type A sorting domain-containing protein [Bacteroidales bacterium]